jgi:HD-like signal output (HDOD) protein
MEVMNELQSPDASIDRVGKIIAKDPAMSAKILQLVNSAFFGFPTRITHPSRAVTILGLEKVKSLVLSIHVFSQFETAQLPNFSLDGLWDHCLKVANYAKLIAKEAGAAAAMVDDCFSAGLLHDTGCLVLVGNMASQYGEALHLKHQKNITLEAAETEVFQATHGEIGAYLLGLWGLPHPIIEAVAFHHDPQSCFNNDFSPLLAVHLADAFELEQHLPQDGSIPSPLQLEFVQACGVADSVPRWRQLCLDETHRAQTANSENQEGDSHA